MSTVDNLLERLAPAEEWIADWPDVLERAQHTRSFRLGGLGRVFGGRSVRVAVVASLAVATTIAVLVSWQPGPSFVEQARAAVGDGPVMHVVVERTTPSDGSLRDLATGDVIPRVRQTEIWFDAARDLKKTRITLGGAVLDEQLETKEGGWSRGGRIYTCAWIAGHPVEATQAGVSCNPSGDNGTVPRQIPERPPSLDLALAGFVDHYRSALETGHARAIGEGTVDGHAVQWLRIATPTGTQNVAVDQSTHKPVLIEASNGASRLQVRLAETVPFMSATFTKPEVVPRQIGGSVVAETSIDIARTNQLLTGQAVWLGQEWNGLRLVSVTQQERAVRYGEDAPITHVQTLKLSYAHAGEPAGAARDVIDLYQSSVCVVRVGWRCTPEDPTDATTVGFPFGTDGPIAQVHRRGTYVSIWSHERNPGWGLMDVARSLRPLAP